MQVTQQWQMLSKSPAVQQQVVTKQQQLQQQCLQPQAQQAPRTPAL
jgi:hypothetical protein